MAHPARPARPLRGSVIAPGSGTVSCRPSHSACQYKRESPTNRALPQQKTAAPVVPSGHYFQGSSVAVFRPATQAENRRIWHYGAATHWTEAPHHPPVRSARRAQPTIKLVGQRVGQLCSVLVFEPSSVPILTSPCRASASALLPESAPEASSSPRP